MDSIILLKAFVTKYPQSEFTQQAELRIEELSWEDAREKDVWSGYKSYLSEYPTGKFADQAKSRIEEKSLAQKENWRHITSKLKIINHFHTKEFLEYYALKGQSLVVVVFEGLGISTNELKYIEILEDKTQKDVMMDKLGMSMDNFNIGNMEHAATLLSRQEMVPLLLCLVFSFADFL